MVFVSNHSSARLSRDPITVGWEGGRGERGKREGGREGGREGEEKREGGSGEREAYN